MNRRTLGIVGLALLLITPLYGQGEVKRGAGRGAAMGAIWGLLMGGNLGAAASGAAAGAAMGAAGGAFIKKDKKRAREQAELERIRQEELRKLEQEKALEVEKERLALEQERLKLAEERRRLERDLRQAAEEAEATPYHPETEEEWIAAIGEDNYSALDALVDCQHQRADLLAQAGATSDNPDFQLASRWVQALIALDQRDSAVMQQLYEELVIIDPEVDTVQQVSLEADRALLDLRGIRREEGISCSG